MISTVATAPQAPKALEADLLRRLLRAAGRVDGRDELRSIAAEAALTGAGVELQEDLAAAAQLAERLASHQRREAELLALSDSARDLTSLRDLDRVLQAIVRRARQLLGSEVGYLSLYDEERRDFFVRATEGSVSEDFARIRVPLGVGICGAVARDKRPLFSSAYVNDRRFSHAKSIDTGVLAENITSILGVPLLVNEQSIGVLFVADRIQHSYTPQQIALLDSLGAHAAVAIENARLFEQSQQALAREREAGARLRATTLEVQSAAEVHEQITSLLAGGGDLPDLADVLARELDGPVLLVDDELEPLCGAAPGDRPPPVTADQDLRDAFHRSSALGRTVELDAGHCWAASAAGMSGSKGGVALWRETSPSQSETRTLERAAMMVALVMLARERVAAAEHRAMAELVEALRTRPLSDPRRFAREARRYGVDLDAPLTMLVLDVDAARATLAVRAAMASENAVLVEAAGDALTVIVARSRAATELRALRRAMEQALGAPPTGVIAQPAGLDAVPEAHHRALRGVRLLRNLGRAGEVVEEHELAPYALLLGGDRDAELDRYCTMLLQPLLGIDGPRGEELMRTLLTFLDLGRNTTAAAAALHIHANTLRQRLEKITALIPDWDDPGRRLDVHLALRLWSFSR
jgi:GAF domain-containing protein